MSFSIILVDSFVKELKRLNKKYPSIKSDLTLLGQQLLDDPKSGTPVGNDCYKIRIAITSKGKGNSGGARVITHVLIQEETIYMLSIYDKSDAETVSEEDILKRIKSIT